MRMCLTVVAVVGFGLSAHAEQPGPKGSEGDGADAQLLDQSLGLGKAIQRRTALKWDSGHPITPGEVRACADQVLKSGACLGFSARTYVVAILMSGGWAPDSPAGGRPRRTGMGCPVLA